MKLGYATVWRWHFYAGLFLAPVLVFLAVTGSIYLFDEEIDAWRYGHLQRVEARATAVPAAAQLEAVRRSHPGASIVSYRPPPAPGRTARVGVRRDGRDATVYVDPYRGTVVGSVVTAEKFTEIVRDLHEKFLAGRVGNWIVEAAASWLVVMIISGLFLWWPRGRGAAGTFVPRLGRGGRTFWRDLHAVAGFWLALLLLFQGLTGLAWSDVWGDGLKKAAASVDAGFPPGNPFNPPATQIESTVPTGAVADDVPWAAQDLPVPASEPGGADRRSVDEIMAIAESRGVPPGYTVRLPRDERGVFTITVSTDRPQEGATLHVDQYSGAVLADLRFEDHGIVAKAITVGIKVHQGDYFGWANKALILAVALGLIGMVGAGVTMWWRRKPPGESGAPRPDEDADLPPWTPAVIVALGVLFPLFGVTLLAALAVDRLVVRRVPALRRWLG